MKSLLMTPDNAQKCFEGIKTQTRRIIKPQPISIVSELKEHSSVPGYWIPYSEDKRMVNNNPGSRKNDCGYYCPYRIGEQVYIREIHKFIQGDGKPNDFGVEYKSGQIIWWRDNGGQFNYPIIEKWRSSIHMPEWAARTKPVITNVRVERVQDISEEDAKAEGAVCSWIKGDAFWGDAYNYTSPHSFEPEKIGSTYTLGFRFLWDGIHGEGAWERNEWVWVYDFKKMPE